MCDKVIPLRLPRQYLPFFGEKWAEQNCVEVSIVWLEENGSCRKTEKVEFAETANALPFSLFILTWALNIQATFRFKVRDRPSHNAALIRHQQPLHHRAHFEVSSFIQQKIIILPRRKNDNFLST
jgi:hypothetical protein